MCVVGIPNAEHCLVPHYMLDGLYMTVNSKRCDLSDTCKQGQLSKSLVSNGLEESTIRLRRMEMGAANNECICCHDLSCESRRCQKYRAVLTHCFPFLGLEIGYGTRSYAHELMVNHRRLRGWKEGQVETFMGLKEGALQTLIGVSVAHVRQKLGSSTLWYGCAIPATYYSSNCLSNFPSPSPPFFPPLRLIKPLLPRLKSHNHIANPVARRNY